MVDLLPWILLIGLVLGGILLIARQRPMSEDEYAERLGKGNALGNALLQLQEILGQGNAENLRKAKTELREEADPGGDPPEPEAAEEPEAPPRPPAR